MKIIQTIPIFLSYDLDRTEKFYELLGFSGPRNYPDYLMLKADGQEIHFYLHGDDHVHEAGENSCYIRASGVDEIYQRLSGAGVKLDPPVAQPWGMLEMSFSDPDGNFLRIGERIEA